MIEKLRRDNIWTGMFLGIIVPGLLFGLLFGIITIVELFTGNIGFITIQKVLLLSIVPNLFLLRYYLLKLHFDLTGRGILVSTFLLAIVFVILEMVM